MPAISPKTYTRLTAAAGWSLAAIVITGAAVRLTGSGLGCPDWPTCHQDRLVPEVEYHALIEFVNRTFTGVVSIAVVLAVLGAVWRRPRRRDLVWLSLGLVAGVLVQIVLGGLTVLYELSPPFVMAHFLVSMVLIANAVVLHHRAKDDPTETGAPPSVPDGIHALSRVVVALAVVVLITGTVVTAAGPHGGDEYVVRLARVVSDVARVHAVAVITLLASIITLGVLLHRRPHASNAHLDRGRRAVHVLLAVAVAQGAVGYTQYFTGVPVLLVGVHIAGATAVWVCSVRVLLALPRRQAARIGAWSPPRRSRSSVPPPVRTPTPTGPGS